MVYKNTEEKDLSKSMIYSTKLKLQKNSKKEV